MTQQVSDDDEVCDSGSTLDTEGAFTSREVEWKIIAHSYSATLYPRMIIILNHLLTRLRYRMQTSMEHKSKEQW